MKGVGDRNEDFEKFMSYDDKTWERTTFCKGSKGFVVTSLKRIGSANKNKQETEKFQKEQRICKTFASFGFQIEHLSEIPGISSHDINIIHHPEMGRVLIKGELKSTRSSNNINGYAKHAIFDQGAKCILFEFTAKSKRIINQLNDLSNKGIHGYYYFRGSHEYGSF